MCQRNRASGISHRQMATIGAPVMRKKALRPMGVQILSLRIPTKGWAMKPKARLTKRRSPRIVVLEVNSLMVNGSRWIESCSVVMSAPQIRAKAIMIGHFCGSLLTGVSSGVGIYWRRMPL